jgi:hypothetical protein
MREREREREREPEFFYRKAHQQHQDAGCKPKEFQKKHYLKYFQRLQVL